MSSFVVPGLPGPVDSDILNGIDLAQSLTPQDLVEWMLALRSIGLPRAQALAGLAQLPLSDVIASPFGLRAVALGVEAGAAAVHIELRPLLPAAARDEVRDPRHGQWDRGKLHIGKYQSFTCDAAMATFDPSHIAKWGAHELLHRAVGFFYREDASLFEHYVGARLNETLPVNVFYGHDQFARANDLEGFNPYSKAPELADAHWFFESKRDLLQRAKATFEWFLLGTHFLASELAAVEEELTTGQCVARQYFPPNARLDPSSDAAAYASAHIDRLRHPAVAAVLRHIPKTLGRFDRLRPLWRNVAKQHNRLLFADITINTHAHFKKRMQRYTWDVAARSAQLGLTIDEAEFVAALSAADGNVSSFLPAKPAKKLDLACSDGLHTIDLSLVRDGLRSVSPKTDEQVPQEVLADFAGSEHFLARENLSERFSRFLESDPDAPQALRDLHRFETLIAQAKKSNAAFLIEWNDDDPYVYINSDFVVFHSLHPIDLLHQGQIDLEQCSDTESTFAWLIGSDGDEVAVIPLSMSDRTEVERLQKGARKRSQCGVSPEVLSAAVQVGAIGSRAAAKY